MKMSKRLLLAFFVSLILFNSFAPAFFTYLSSRSFVVYAQSETTLDPASTNADGGTESVSAGVSCYDTGSKEKGLWDKVSGIALNPAVVAGTGGASLGVGVTAVAAKKVGGVLDFVNNPLKWFVCGVSAMLTGAINFLNKTMNRLMLFDPTKTQEEANKAYKKDCETSSVSDKDCTSFTSLGDGTNNLKEIWKHVLNISNIFLIIGFLIMVISTALDISVFSSYTVKKVLPKIIIAAIAANLSWVICSTVISGVNYIGIGIQAVMIHPFTGNVDEGLGKAVTAVTGDAISGGGSAFQGPVAVGIGTVTFAIFASAGAILLPILAFVLLAVLVAFLVFLVRRIIIIMLVIAAPLAFMAWAIPGGESWFKKWWKAFTQVLLVYPYAMVLFGSGILISGVIGQTKAGDDGAIGAVINAFLMIIALLLPYFLLPTAFKMVGGALGTITGKLNDKSKGLVDRAKNARDGSNYGLSKARRKEMTAARKKRGWEEGLQKDNLLGRARRRQAYGGAGLNPLRHKTNQEYNEALQAQAGDKYQKEQREIQKLRLGQRRKDEAMTNDQYLDEALAMSQTGRTRAERDAGRDILVDNKDEKRFHASDEYSLSKGLDRATEADLHRSDRYSDIKAFAVHGTTELRTGEGGSTRLRSSEEWSAAQTSTMAGATDETKSTQKASGVLRTAALDSSGKIMSDFERISKNSTVNSRLDPAIKDALLASNKQAITAKDLAGAVRSGMAGATGPAPNQPSGGNSPNPNPGNDNAQQ